MAPVLRVLAAIRDGFNQAIPYPARLFQRLAAFLYTLAAHYHGATLANMARQESFALGMLLMTALALGMAFLL